MNAQVVKRVNQPVFRTAMVIGEAALTWMNVLNV
jgi:hypothetical protein